VHDPAGVLVGAEALGAEQPETGEIDLDQDADDHQRHRNAEGDEEAAADASRCSCVQDPCPPDPERMRRDAI
jgi:hypothetical protein